MQYCLTNTELLFFLESSDDASGVDNLIAHLDSCKLCQAKLDVLAVELTKRLVKIDDSSSFLAEGQRMVFTPNETWVSSLPNYRVIRKIGHGGMGEVFECHDRRLNRRVAIKTLKSDRIEPALLERHRREALLQAELNHPHVVSVYAFEISPEGFPFFVMEMIDGQTLASLIRDRTLTTRQTVSILTQVARAVAFAHEHQILHRDLKPSNVLLVAGIQNKPKPENEPINDRYDAWVAKITDFGLARLLNTSSALTPTQSIMGTPAYLAPECVNSSLGKSGVASDIYALGVILYECLTGRPPFFSENVTEIIRMIQESEPVSPGKLNPALARDLETICLKCLEKQPSRRYETAAALADDLNRFSQGLPIKARPLSLFGQVSRWYGRNVRLAGAVTLLCLSWLALGLGGYWFAYQQAELRRVAEDRTAQARLAEQKAINQSDFARNNFMSSLYLSSDIVKSLSKLEGLENPRQAIPPVRQQLEARIARSASIFVNDFMAQMDQSGIDLDQHFKNAMEVRGLGFVDQTIPVFERLIELARRTKPSDKNYWECISVGMRSATILGLTYQNQNKPAQALAVLADAWRQWPVGSTLIPGLSEVMIRDRLILGTTYQEMLNQASRQSDAQALTPDLQALQQALFAKQGQK